jgi:hypothetical protein
VSALGAALARLAAAPADGAAWAVLLEVVERESRWDALTAEVLAPLCLLDDAQAELALLGRALRARPDAEVLLDAYLSVALRSGVVFVDDADALGEASVSAAPAVRARLLAWRAVLGVLSGAGGEADPALLAVGRAWLETGARPAQAQRAASASRMARVRK